VIKEDKEFKAIQVEKEIKENKELKAVEVQKVIKEILD